MELYAEVRRCVYVEGLVETTRPAGQQSYAQYISTAGWATLALLGTR